MIQANWEMCEEGIWIHDSGYNGPNVAIMGGTHGDEETGLQVVDRYLDTPPHIEEGSVTLILGNPLASSLGRHYIDRNLNRLFLENPGADLSGYEADRAEVIKPYLQEASALLDIHDTSSPCEPFLICERNALDTALKIGKRATGSGMTIAFGFSKMEPGGSDDFMFLQGKEGICFESDDMQCAQNNVAAAQEIATRFLIVQGLAEGEIELPETDPLMIEVYRSIICSEDFEWKDYFYNFQMLNSGKPLATSNGKEILATFGDVILFPARELVLGDEACEIAKIVN